MRVQNNLMRGLTLPILLAGFLSGVSYGQSPQTTIQTETLDAARAFDAGALNTGDNGLELDLGLGLWSGTPSERAMRLIKDSPILPDDNNPHQAIIRDMVRAALLSAGEPPQGNREVFEQARLRTVMALGDETALNVLMARNPVLAQSPMFRTERALAQGDGEAACAVADQVTQGRADPDWARLRIVCHVLRDEIAAAELTRDLLQNSGYEDANYFALLGIMLRGNASQTLPSADGNEDALINFMRNTLSQNSASESLIDKSLILDSTQAPQARLASLWANLNDVSADDLTSVMSDIAFNPNDVSGSSRFDLVSAQADPSHQGTGQLFLLARGGSIEALSAFLARAPQDLQPILQDKMYDVLPPLPGADMIALDLVRFTHEAIEARDIGTLQALHKELEGDARQGRLALAADSIGNGFNFGALGRDIDGRLQAADNKLRARRDAMLALAMGAKISDAARDSLSGYNFDDGRKISDGDLIILRQAAKSGSRAELVLLIAKILDGPSLDTPSLTELVRLLTDTGLPQFAGRIAAQDFISDL